MQIQASFEHVSSRLRDALRAPGFAWATGGAGSCKDGSSRWGLGSGAGIDELRQRLAVLLGEVGLHDVLRDRRRGRAVLVVLAENDAGDFGIVARREEDEPAVVAEVALGTAGGFPAARSEITWAVPVLPETSLPGMRARPPVPAPLTTR